jgi:hypothetical protein
MAYSIRDPKKQLKATTAVRDGFREGKDATDDEVVANLLEECEKHISYLKIVGAKRPKATKQDGRQTYRRDPETGKWISGSASRQNATTVGGGHWGSVTSDHVRKARSLNTRQHFGGR